MNIIKSPYFVLLLLLILVVSSLFISNETAYDFEGYNYAIFQGLLFYLVYILKKEGVQFLLSPSFLAVAYINFNFILGSIFFKNELVFTKLLPEFRKWDHYDYRIFFFNTINFLIILSYFLGVRFRLKRRKLPMLLDLKRINPDRLLYTTVFLFAIISFLKFPFAVVAKSMLAMVMFILISQKYDKLGKRIFLYAIILFVFILFSVHSKREAIFLLLPLILIEFQKVRIKVNFKTILKLTFGLFVLMYAIITMSILRGYGGFKVDGFWDASKHVPDYVTSHYFVPAIANNLEISSTYLHSNNSIEYLKRGEMEYSYGETFIKPAFIIFPRWLIDKPDSAIEAYTTAYDAKFRAEGGSMPISIQSEFFLNFGMYSLFFIVPFFMFFNGMYKSIYRMIGSGEIVNFAYGLYVYEIFLSLIRGSGLDIFIVYFIFLMFFFFMYKISMKMLIIPLNAQRSV